MRMFVKTRNVFKKDWVLMVNNHCKYITIIFHVVFKCFVVPILCWFSFLFLRYVEGSDTIATRYQET